MTDNPLGNPLVGDVEKTEATPAIKEEPMGQPKTPFSLGESGKPEGVVGNTSIFQSMAAQKAEPPTLASLYQETQQQVTTMQQAQQALGALPSKEALPHSPYLPLIADKLNKVGGNLHDIQRRLNLSPIKLPKLSGGERALAGFLNYLTGSQDAVKRMGEQLATMPKNQANLGDLLAVQSKMNGISQQMQLVTVLIGKVVDDVKTLMNLQI